MTNLSRVRCLWQGWPGAPGYSNFYCTDPVAAVPYIRVFWDALKGIFPTNLTVQVQGSGDVIDDATGTIVSGWTTDEPLIVTGNGGTTAYAGNAGAVILWTSGTILDGRRPMGKTYLVPLIGTVYDAAGSLSSGTITTINGAANTLSGNPLATLKIWHRPRVADPTADPPITARAGGNVPLTGYRVPDLAATLRSRRT